LGYVDPGRRQAANRILRAAVTLRARVSRVRADSAGGHLAGRGGGAGERAAPVRDVPRPASRGPDGLLRSRDELPQPVQEGGRMMAEKVLVRPALDLDARASTGISGLDDMLEGGFPVGSLSTRAGRPRTGQTILAPHFLYQGAREAAEPGMYVSMLEGRKAYLDRKSTR